jgi:hypothetical protein
MFQSLPQNFIKRSNDPNRKDIQLLLQLFTKRTDLQFGQDHFEWFAHRVADGIICNSLNGKHLGAYLLEVGLISLDQPHVEKIATFSAVYKNRAVIQFLTDYFPAAATIANASKAKEDEAINKAFYARQEGKKQDDPAGSSYETAIFVEDEEPHERKFIRQLTLKRPRHVFQISTASSFRPFTDDPTALAEHMNCTEIVFAQHPNIIVFAYLSSEFVQGRGDSVPLL